MTSSNVKAAQAEAFHVTGDYDELAPDGSVRANSRDLSMRLLIVEDNEELAGLLTKGLRTAGYEAQLRIPAAQCVRVLRNITLQKD